MMKSLEIDLIASKPCEGVMTQFANYIEKEYINCKLNVYYSDGKLIIESNDELSERDIFLIGRILGIIETENIWNK